MTTLYNHGIITYNSATLTLPQNGGVLESNANIEIPIGLVIAYVGNGSAPTGWLFCNGTAISRTTYSALYSVIGTKYGSGDGVTTFNLPNMMSGAEGYGIFPAGSATTANDGFNVDGVRKIQSGTNNQKITINQIPSHNHAMNHFHTIPSHNHTISEHSHSGVHTHIIPEHSHSITSTRYYSTLGPNKSEKANTGLNTRFRYGEFGENITSFPTSTDNYSGNLTTYTASTTDNTNTTIPDFETTSQSTSITGNSSVTNTDNTPSTQTDYVPSFTAFLWIIKF